MNKFEVGKVYETRSICDNDCRFRFQVVSRTAATVTVKDLADGKIIKRGISKSLSAFFGCEAFKPYGTYSMSPTITAEKVAA